MLLQLLLMLLLHRHHLRNQVLASVFGGLVGRSARALLWLSMVLLCLFFDDCSLCNIGLNFGKCFLGLFQLFRCRTLFQYVGKSSTHVLELKVRTCDWVSVLLAWVIIEVNPFIVDQVTLRRRLRLLLRLVFLQVINRVFPLRCVSLVIDVVEPSLGLRIVLLAQLVAFLELDHLRVYSSFHYSN